MEASNLPLVVAFQCAINDALNVFMRDVLRPRLALIPGALELIDSDDVESEKQRIVREWAAKWVTFEGYERPPANE